MILNPREADYGVERGLLDASERDDLERSGLIRSDVPGWPLARDDEMERLGASPRREHVRYVWWIVALLKLRREGWSVVGSRERSPSLTLALGILSRFSAWRFPTVVSPMRTFLKARGSSLGLAKLSRQSCACEAHRSKP